MVVRELMLALRELLYDISDTGEPPANSGCVYYWEYDDRDLLWTNKELLRYLNDACDELARRAPIHDSGRSSLTRVTMTPGTSRYPISERLLAIDDVLLDSTRAPLEKLSDAKEFNFRFDGDRRHVDPEQVQYYREDFDERVLTVYAAPTARDTLLLSVRRLPAEPLRWEQRACQEPEFPEHIQPTLLQWAASLAYRKRDTDTNNIELAGFHQGQFTSAVGPQINFQAQRIRKDLAGQRVRTRAYYY